MTTERTMDQIREFVRDTVEMHEREIKRASVNIDWCRAFLAEIEQQQREQKAHRA
jgi:hypothetical protein